jgi:hypothetical protein
MSYLSYLSGGKQDASGQLRPSLTLRSTVTLPQERALESTDAVEAEMWPQWMLMRDHIWAKTSGSARNVDRNGMVYDLDDVMRTVFETSVFGAAHQATLEVMTDRTVAILLQKWNYSFTPPPATSTMPASLAPVFSSTKKGIENIFM